MINPGYDHSLQFRLIFRGHNGHIGDTTQVGDIVHPLVSRSISPDNTSPVHAEENEYQRRRIPIYNLERELIGEAWGYMMTPAKIALGWCLGEAE